MRTSKSGKRKRIDWQRIIKEGTGFFGWPSLNIPGLTPSNREARQAAWNRMGPAIAEAETLGADGDFLRACCLHLAEIAVERHRSRDVLQLSGDRTIRLGSIRETLKYHVEKVRQESEKLRGRWTEAKEAILCHAPELVGADKVDDALSAFDSTLTNFLRIYFPLNQHEKSPGRPRDYHSLVALSGMAWHLKDKILRPARKKEPARYSLLSRITKALYPPLPMATMPVRLKSKINRHREDHSSTGKADLDTLMKEFRTMCRKFLAQP